MALLHGDGYNRFIVQDQAERDWAWYVDGQVWLPYFRKHHMMYRRELVIDWQGLSMGEYDA